ncbi:hypothetical protein QUF70_12255 [Desulfobacterales bacterium HSG17]|nr:hypothetical protein [Desulfobacterales bacterium HSG17]
MAAAFIEVLRKSLNPGWLTPLSYQVEALGYACRFKEAHAISLPNLEVGKKREPPNHFYIK